MVVAFGGSLGMRVCHHRRCQRTLQANRVRARQYCGFPDLEGSSEAQMSLQGH